MSKALVDGKRPGDTFTRLGDRYRVISVRGGKVITESIYGREVWF
jgi:hypothetical protein